MGWGLLIICSQWWSHAFFSLQLAIKLKGGTLFLFYVVQSCDFYVVQTYQVSISPAQDGLISPVPLCAWNTSRIKKAAASFWLEKVILLQANPHFHWCSKAQSAPTSGQVTDRHPGSRTLSSVTSHDRTQNVSVPWPQQAGQAFLPTWHHLSYSFSHTKRELSWGKCWYNLTTVTKRPWQQNTLKEKSNQRKVHSYYMALFLERFFFY